MSEKGKEGAEGRGREGRERRKRETYIKICTGSQRIQEKGKNTKKPMTFHC